MEQQVDIEKNKCSINYGLILNDIGVLTAVVSLHYASRKPKESKPSPQKVKEEKPTKESKQTYPMLKEEKSPLLDSLE